MTAARRRAAAALAAAALAVALAACQGSADFMPASFEQVEDALVANDVRICESHSSSFERLPGAQEGRQYRLAADSCPSGERRLDLLQVQEFESEADRQAAARSFQGARGRAEGFGAQGTVWTYGPFVIALTGERSDETVDEVTEAMDELGAE